MINKKISTIAGSLIIVAILAALGFSFLGSNKKEEAQNNIVLDNLDLGNKEEVKQNEEKIVEDTQSEENKEEIIMEDVYFCDKLYKSEKVIINNVNIAESVAKVANEKNLMCKILEMGKFQESGIGIFQKKEESKNNSYLIVFFHLDNQKEKDDPLDQSSRIFRFDFDNDKIYFQSQFDAKFNYIGDIK